MVYTRTAPIRVLESGGLRAGITAGSGVFFGVDFVVKELGSFRSCSLVVDPPQPGVRKSERVRVLGDTYVSVRRFTEGVKAEHSKFDCLDMLVRVGDKITIQGTAVPLAELIAPHAPV